MSREGRRKGVGRGGEGGQERKKRRREKTPVDLLEGGEGGVMLQILIQKGRIVGGRPYRMSRNN
jgi:hypothetical protein